MIRKHHYLVLPPEATEDRYVLIGSEPILIGRSSSARIRLYDSAVSGQHCRITREGEAVFAEDLGSTNGTIMDDRQIEGRVPFPVGAVLQVGRNLLRHEALAAEELRRRQMVNTELKQATTYVRSLLPPPIPEGSIRAEWRFIPSASLGGDAFGYHWLDDRRFCVFVLDVCGHGAAAALHSVAVVHVLRKQNLRGVDFGRPDQVLSVLNSTFPMEEHGGLFLTAWYGVYDRETRRLSYASGGHPPGVLTGAAGEPPEFLGSSDLPVGMLPESSYSVRETQVSPGSRLYLVSDGTFEVRTRDGNFLELEELHRILTAGNASGEGEVERVERAIRSRMKEHDFPDDFTLLCLHID